MYISLRNPRNINEILYTHRVFRVFGVCWSTIFLFNPNNFARERSKSQGLVALGMRSGSSMRYRDPLSVDESRRRVNGRAKRAGILAVGAKTADDEPTPPKVAE